MGFPHHYATGASARGSATRHPSQRRRAAAWGKGRETAGKIADLIDPETGGFELPPPAASFLYNEFLVRAPGRQRSWGSRRTSLIVDPPNGRLPPLTPDGKVKADCPRIGGARDLSLDVPRAELVGRPTPAGALHPWA